MAYATNASKLKYNTVVLLPRYFLSNYCRNKEILIEFEY